MTYGMGSFDPAALVSAIREGMSSVNGSGDIVIPRNGFYTVSEF